jgi:hypothetical protein
MHRVLSPRLARALTRVARLVRGRADDEEAVGLGGGGAATGNRIFRGSPHHASGFSSEPVGPVWGTSPDRAKEFVIDVRSCADTIAGLTALDLGAEAEQLADPFRVVVNRNGLFFYSYGDRKHLDLWIGWSTLKGLAPTVVPKHNWIAGRTEGLNAIGVTAVNAQGAPVSFPLIARRPGSGFGLATDLSTAREQQAFIERIDSFYADRPPVADTDVP